MKHYHLDEALKRARKMRLDVQRNHESNGRTEVVVSWKWEIVKRGFFTTGNASGQAAFINSSIDRIMSIVNAKIPGVLYRSDRGFAFAVIGGQGHVWDRGLKLWQRSLSSVDHIESAMERIGFINVRRTKVYWPEEL